MLVADWNSIKYDMNNFIINRKSSSPLMMLLFIVFYFLYGHNFVFISRTIYYIIRTWLTEPGICIRGRGEEVSMEPSIEQRQVTNAINNMKNGKMEIISVCLIGFTLSIAASP